MRDGCSRCHGGSWRRGSPSTSTARKMTRCSQNKKNKTTSRGSVSLHDVPDIQLRNPTVVPVRVTRIFGPHLVHSGTHPGSPVSHAMKGTSEYYVQKPRPWIPNVHPGKVWVSSLHSIIQYARGLKNQREVEVPTPAAEECVPSTHRGC